MDYPKVENQPLPPVSSSNLLPFQFLDFLFKKFWFDPVKDEVKQTETREQGTTPGGWRGHPSPA